MTMRRRSLIAGLFGLVGGLFVLGRRSSAAQSGCGLVRPAARRSLGQLDALLFNCRVRKLLDAFVNRNYSVVLDNIAINPDGTITVAFDRGAAKAGDVLFDLEQAHGQEIRSKGRRSPPQLGHIIDANGYFQPPPSCPSVPLGAGETVFVTYVTVEGRPGQAAWQLDVAPAQSPIRFDSIYFPSPEA